MAEASTEKPPPIVTRDEARNGWTPERLASYLAERDAQKIDYTTRMSARKHVEIQNTTSFNPFGW